eukprot:SAG11_NODE_10847_length_802_cov_0.941679_2_plen_20_part_01
MFLSDFTNTFSLYTLLDTKN